MALNDIPSKLEAVFIQRDINNQYYEQINISGSNIIVYLDETGKVNADKIDDFFIKYGVSPTGSISSSYSLTASYALTSAASGSTETSSFSHYSNSGSYALTSSYSLNGGGGGSSLSSSWASQSLSSSYTLVANTASLSLTSSLSRTSSISLTASLSVTSSYSRTSSLSFTASYALTSAASGSTESASFSLFSVDSDKLDGQHGQFYQTASNLLSGYIPQQRLTGSYTITSSIAINADQLDGQHGQFYQTASNLLSGYIFSSRLSGSYFITSSWSTSSISSSYSLTASYSLNGGGTSSPSSSWSSQSLSSSYATNASLAYSINFIPINALSSSFASSSLTASFLPNSTYQFTSAYASNSDQLDGQHGNFYQTASNLLSGIIPIERLTGSYNITSSQSISASIAQKTRREILTSEPIGFVDRVTSTLVYESSSGKFDISGSYIVFCNGNEYIKGNESIVITSPVKGSKYYIYFDISGVLSYSSSPWNINSGNCPIATIYINPLDSTGMIGDERHGIEMDSQTHEYIHETLGPRYAHGFGWTTLTSSIGTYNLSAGEWYDDDNEYDINYIQSGSKIAYFSGSGMCIPTAPTSSIWGGGTPRYNDPITGQLVTLTANQYVAFWVYLLNGYTDKLLVIYGQRVDSTLATSIDNNIPDNLVLGNFPVEEGKLIYRIIVRGNSTISDVTDYRSDQFGGAGNYTSNDHGSLAGLSDDDHAQYLLLAGRTGGQVIIGGITASLLGTSSYSENSLYLNGNLGIFYQTASNLLSGIIPIERLTGSYNITSSWSNNSISSSNTSTASYSFNSDIARSASFSSNSVSSSFSITSSYIFQAEYSIASDFAVSAGVCESSSYALTASYAFNGGGTSSPSSSWASQSLSASYLNNYNVYSLYTITASTNTIPLNFNNPEQMLNITASTNITFSAVSSSTDGLIQDISIFINNTSPSNTGLYFPSTWKNIGSVWPTSLTASKSAIISLRSVNNSVVIGTYAPEL